MKYGVLPTAFGWVVVVYDESTNFSQVVGPFRSKKLATENIEHISLIAGRAWLNGGAAERRWRPRSSEA